MKDLIKRTAEWISLPDDVMAIILTYDLIQIEQIVGKFL